MFSPAKLTAEVKSIEMHHQGLQTALPGHNVGFNIKNVSVKNLRRGDVAGNAQHDPPSDVSSFEAQVCTKSRKRGRSTQTNKGLASGASPLLTFRLFSTELLSLLTSENVPFTT